MADKYYRLVCFVVNICPEPLRQFFIKLANQDEGSSYTTVDAYLAYKRSAVMQLKKKKRITEDQYDLLYPGQGTTDVDQWDVTLLVTLLTEMFETSIQPLDIFLMKNEIRGIRNELQHLPNTSNMTDKEFDDYWRRLDTATIAIAKQVFSAGREELFRKTIENAKSNNLPNLGDTLRQWYEETIKQMQSVLVDIKSNTKETTSVLRQVTVQKPGSSGDKNKRIKTADGILSKLQASFETTMNELPEDFNAPSEVADIRTKLRNNHYVVVTGSYNSRYFETALAAIKGMGYNYKRSVEMHESSDWLHIDPEDVDFVLCRNPFGSFSYDENKAKAMADIFKSMMHTTKGDGNKTLDLVIVTDLTILTECKQYHDHDILEEIVKVFDDTSESRPADLTLGCRNQNMTSNCFPVANNLGVLTSNFLKQYSISSSQENESVIKEARDKFKAKKAIVLTGPRKCGKTSVAVALASSYQPSQCSLLTKPSDFLKIDFQNICLIIIDEFAGKYCYDEKTVYKWFSMFDHLYNAITAGQMNVVITCEKSKLDKCCTEISSHPILDHRVDIPARTTVIKQEMELQNTELGTGPQFQIDGQQRVTHNQASIPSEQLFTGSNVWSVKDTHKSNIRVNGDTVRCRIEGCCLLPSGDIVLADNGNHNLKKLNAMYQVISVCYMSDKPYDVCYIDNNTAAVTMDSTKLQFVDIRGGMTLTKSVDTDHSCRGLTYGNNQLYVTNHRSVYIYSKDGIKQHILYTHNFDRTSLINIALNNDGSLIFISNTDHCSLVTIDSSGNHLYTFTDSESGEISGVCVDGEGHVLVSIQGSYKILQFSSDGKKKLGIISEGSDCIYWSGTLCFDKENTTLVVAGVDDNINVLELQ